MESECHRKCFGPFVKSEIRMKKTVFSALLHEKCTEKDYTQMISEINRSLSIKSITMLSENKDLTVKSIFSQLFRTINTFFDCVLGFEFAEKDGFKFFEDSNEEREAYANRKLETELYLVFKSEMRNIQIFSMRISKFCSESTKFTVDQRKNIKSFFSIVCWDKWLRHLRESVVIQAITIDYLSFSQNLKQEEQSTLDDPEKRLKLDTDIDVYENYPSYKGDPHTDEILLSEPCSPVTFLYKVTNETENLHKWTKLIKQFVKEQREADLSTNLIKLNRFAEYFEGIGIKSFIEVCKIEISKLFPGENDEKIFDFLISFKDGRKFSFYSLIDILDLNSVFAKNILEKDMFEHFDIECGLFRLILEKIAQLEEEFETLYDPATVKYFSPIKFQVHDGEYQELFEHEKNFDASGAKLLDELKKCLRTIHNHVKFLYADSHFLFGDDRIDVWEAAESLLIERYKDSLEFSYCLSKLVFEIIFELYRKTEKSFETILYMLDVTKSSSFSIGRPHGTCKSLSKDNFDFHWAIDKLFHFFRSPCSVCTHFADDLTKMLITEVACRRLDVRVAKYVAWNQFDYDYSIEYKLGLADYTTRYNIFKNSEVFKLKYQSGFICGAELSKEYAQKTSNLSKKSKDLLNPQIMRYSVDFIPQLPIRIFNQQQAPFKSTKHFVPNYLIQKRFNSFSSAYRDRVWELEFNYELSEMSIEYEGLHVNGDLFRISVLLDLIDWVHYRFNSQREDFEASLIPKLIYKSYFGDNKTIEMTRQRYTFSDIIEDLRDFGIIEIRQITEEELEETTFMCMGNKARKRPHHTPFYTEFDYNGVRLCLSINTGVFNIYRPNVFHIPKILLVEAVETHQTPREDIIKCEIVKQMKKKKKCTLESLKQKIISQNTQNDEKTVDAAITSLISSAFLLLEGDVLTYVP